MTELETRYVFVDTSMYENKNFQFHQHTLGRFKELCSDHILYLLINSVVDNEVKSHLIEKGQESARHVRDFKKTIKILRNLPEIKHHAIFEELKKEDVERLLLEKFESFKDEAVYENIDINLASLDTIITKYFGKEAPFSNKKKNEFPDAIILESLQEWAKEKTVSVYVLSVDNDMKLFCQNSGGWLTYIDNLDDFINLVVTTENKLSDLSKFAEEQLESQISELESQLEDLINSIEYTTIGYDIDDEIRDCNAYDLVILEKNIIKVDREYAEFSLSIKFTVDAWHDLTDYDRSIWDSEDKKYMFMAKTSRKVQHEVQCNTYILIEFEDALAINTYLSEINIEDSYIELDPDNGMELECEEHDIFDY